MIDDSQLPAGVSTSALYELSFGVDGNRWLLDDDELVDANGVRVDPWYFKQGERLEAVGNLQFPATQAGSPDCATFTPRGILVVPARIGSLVAELAPGDLQRIPARIGSAGGYEVLNVVSTIDCVDWERTRAQVRVDGTLRTGTLASLAPFIERDNLYSYVTASNMTLRLDGIAGARIFRVADWRLWPVVTQELKAELDHECGTSVAFRPMQSSTGRG